MIVWHGNTWHGAFNRRVPGLRVSIPVLMARPFMRTEEDLFNRTCTSTADCSAREANRRRDARAPKRLAG